jgi:site-specific recombinase XerD
MIRSNAAVLSSDEITRLLTWIHENSRCPLRDRLVLLLGFTCGMRITEIARIRVRDVLTSTGLPLKEVSLRAAITKGSKARCAYLSHPSTIATLNEYVAWRVDEGYGIDQRSDRFWAWFKKAVFL